MLSESPAFVHLKVHSAYSLLEGAMPIARLAELCETFRMPALALTDTDNLFGALEFSQTMAASGIQPIVGVSIGVRFNDHSLPPPAGSSPQQSIKTPRSLDGRIGLLASTAAGYANLIKIVSRAHLESDDRSAPLIDISALSIGSDGLIALTGGPDGPINRALDQRQATIAAQRLRTLHGLFGDRLYVELQRHGAATNREFEFQILDLAYAMRLPIVATNEAYFAHRDDFEAHDVLLCIADGRYVVEDDRRRVTPEHYFKSADEMAQLFADLPEALANTVEIAKRCSFRPEGRTPILPRFVELQGEETNADQLTIEATELKRHAEAGLAERLQINGLASGFAKDDYERRLAFELDIITRMRFPGYFLIVADFIKWAKANAIPVGPGRGSGAGSLVAWALTITDLDPLRFGLLFERFLNPERVSMPDFDIDFCQDRRDDVITYVQKKYGSDRVAQIITHGKLQARAVLRDVGRVLQMPYGQVDKLCKLVPNNPANPLTLAEALAGEPKLQEASDTEPIVARLLEIARKLEGLYRHASTHAAGIVIADRPLDELVPLYRDPRSNAPVTQFNWKMVEAAGLVKFDFLGLKTLTVLQKTVDLIKRGRDLDIDLARVPLDDGKTFELLACADTVGVFQLESTGMRESLKRLKPDRFEDIIAMVALYRPGPMNNIQLYISRKHGDEPIDYPHPLLEPILKETYGVTIYQEQVMQIAQVIAGYSLGDADLLRRAMGKKDKLQMARQRARFVDGAMKNGVSNSDAVQMFDLVDKFAGYGFNKSHAAAYALVSYHTAYLKTNFREEFIAASMTLDMANTDKLAMFAEEARRSGIKVLPPCVNASGVEFLAEPAQGTGRGAIRYSMAALKNIGESAVTSIVGERKANGPFRSLADFANRFSAQAINKRALETLAMAGAFDALEPDRALVHGNVDVLLGEANRQHSNSAHGTADLFACATDKTLTIEFRPRAAWTVMERLQAEFNAVGFFLSGHPLDEYASVLEKLQVMRYVDFEAATQRGITSGKLAGIVVSARERRSQRGNKFAFAMFSDPSGQYEAVIFSDTLAHARHLLEPGTPVLLVVEAERDGETLKMRVQGLECLDKAASNIVRGLKIVLDDQFIAKDGRLAELRNCLTSVSAQDGGDVHLIVPLRNEHRQVELRLRGRYDVSPMQAGRLRAAPGVVEVLEI